MRNLVRPHRFGKDEPFIKLFGVLLSSDSQQNSPSTDAIVFGIVFVTVPDSAFRDGLRSRMHFDAKNPARTDRTRFKA